MDTEIIEPVNQTPPLGEGLLNVVEPVKKKRGRPPSGLSPEEILKRDRESMAKSQIRYRARNPEVFNTASKKWYAKKKEDPVWYEKYKEICRKKTAEYYLRKKAKTQTLSI
jgi:hypothetical protein